LDFKRGILAESATTRHNPIMEPTDRGQVVIAKSVSGHPSKLRIWSIGAGVAYLLTEHEFSKRNIGQKSLDPVGVPIEDVFAYTKQNKDILAD
jgi:hypothetical protein